VLTAARCRITRFVDQGALYTPVVDWWDDRTAAATV
jgi:hypothetical protein